MITVNTIVHYYMELKVMRLTSNYGFCFVNEPTITSPSAISFGNLKWVNSRKVIGYKKKKD